MKFPLRQQQQKDSGASSFMPKDYIAKKTEARANVICLTLFAIVMFCVVAAFFATNRELIKVRAEQEHVRVEYQAELDRIEDLKKLQTHKVELFEKAEITTALIERVPRSVLLAEMVQRMPENMTLLNLELKSKRIVTQDTGPAPAKPGAKPVSLTGGAPGSQPAKPEPKVQAPRFEHTLRIEGVARRNSEIADYLSSLEDCEFLMNVDVASIKEAKISNIDLRRFEITAGLRPDADARSITPLKELRQGSKVKSAIESDEGAITGVPDEERP